jgi:hypothetical protein
MSVPPPMPPASPQLTPENLRQLQAARDAMKRLRRVVRVAQFDGWSVGIFGGLTFLVSVVSLLTGSIDLLSLFLGAGMIGVAFVELRGAARIAQLDLATPRTLAFNQVVLAGLLIFYAIWKLGSGGGDSYAAEIAANPELRDIAEPIQEITKYIYSAIYLTLIAVAIFGQGSLALYYFTRTKLIREYAAQTPEWIQTMQRAGVSV